MELKGKSFSPSEPKEATRFTQNANCAVLNDKGLSWGNNRDFEDAKRGFIAKDSPHIITGKNNKTIFDMEIYTDFIKPDSPAPDTVNPSLWRHAQLNTNAGLFKIADSVFMVRGYDLANMAIIEGKSGYIVLDALTNVEASAAALRLVYKTLGEKPIKAVVIGHSHGDHFGGVAGIVDAAMVKNGEVKIIAPDGFESAALREFVLAGPAMHRRLMYQFGRNLAIGSKGVVDSGIGKRGPGGTMFLVSPTVTIAQTGQKITIDGINLVFQVTPDSEAPASMQVYLPQFKALWVGENVNHTNHNLCPLRGALIRDAKKWAEYIHEMTELFPDTEVAFGSHFWPVWGKEEVRNFLKKQHDLYKFTHDQTLRLANHGYTAPEIQQMLKLPASLASEWFNRDYYGTLKFNIHSTYTRYFGWYDGNPVNLDPYPPEETAKRLVDHMGGSAAVLSKAQEAFTSGDYRWAAQLLHYVVFAEPENITARSLMADALEQLGYQQESSTWRNAYLTGALELRSPKVPEGSRNILSYAGMKEKDLFDYLAVCLNCDKAEGKIFCLSWTFSDNNSTYVMTIENAVLHCLEGREAQNADASLTLDRSAFLRLMFSDTPVDELINSGEVMLSGNRDKLTEILQLFDKFQGNFNIMLP
jgi:alkyl sulfatase BDS1-like metallo-beta-lactamase superfamily hydrolase